MGKLFTVFTMAMACVASSVYAEGYRIVNGRFYSPTNSEWRNVAGDYITKNEKLILVQTYRTTRRIIPDSYASAGIGSGTLGVSIHTSPDKIVAITNAPDFESSANGSKINERAIKIGTITIIGETYELWDCGSIYVPPPPTPEQIKAAEEASRIRKAAAEKARKASSEKTLKWNQEQADGGDAYGQLRMGERYRDGDGVEKDLDKARAYFEKAAAQGNKTAQEDLDELSNHSAIK